MHILEDKKEHGAGIICPKSPIFKVMLGRFLGCTNTKQRIKYLAQGYNAMPTVRFQIANPQSQVTHSRSTTAGFIRASMSKIKGPFKDF